MARLIDADKRIQEIKKIYCTGCDNYGGAKCRACWVDDAMCLIDDAATVEVVRCANCSRYKNNIKSSKHSRGICEFDNERKPRNHFCSYGERRTDG